MFLDKDSQLIYDNLCKLRDTGDLSYLINAHDLCGITSDPAYLFHIMLEEKYSAGKKLILYGLGATVRSHLKLERERKNTAGYLYFPFLGDIKWYGVYDKDVSKKVDGWRRLSWTELSEIREDVFICIGTPDYYEEIKEELLQEGFMENCICPYVFPATECYEEKQYYDDFLDPREEEIVVDGGCFRCDTVERFINWNHGRGYKKIISFEPDRGNYDICKNIIEQKGWRNVELIYGGLSDHDMESRIVSNGDDTSYVSLDDIGNDTVKLYALDSILRKWGGHISFIKLDVEGFELETLRGASSIIQRDHPRMAISLYHKVEDLEKIPKFIMKLSADYKFYLRIYSNAYLEIVLYAV